MPILLYKTIIKRIYNNNRQLQYAKKNNQNKTTVSIIHSKNANQGSVHFAHFVVQISCNRLHFSFIGRLVPKTKKLYTYLLLSAESFIIFKSNF